MKDYVKELIKAAQETAKKRNRKQIRESMSDEYWHQFALCWDYALLFGLRSPEFEEANAELKKLAKR